jgi:hypothetical protein
VVSWASPSSDAGAARPLSGAAAGESVATDSLSAGQNYVRYDLPELRTWGFAFIPATEYA